nr:YfdX family protein [Paracoccus yeei]
MTAETDSQLADKRTALIQEAVDALDETNAAIAAIEKGDTDAAIAALALATGKLETVVARE